MPDVNVVAWIRSKFGLLVNDLDERGRRRWAATEALSLGRGGIAAVAEATRLSDRTSRNGIQELSGSEVVDPGRPRRPGAGRRSRAEEPPTLIAALAALVEPTSRGDPVAPLRWTWKSWGKLAAELSQQGFAVSHPTVGQRLKHSGSSLPATRKTREGKDHPDREAQFAPLNRRGAAYGRGGRPALSVATKKKEPLGHKKNGGREERPKGKPVEVDTHDFPDPKVGKAVPSGVYDLAHNEAWVSVGITQDTAEFAVASSAQWGDHLGCQRYPSPGRLLITAESGGSKGQRTRLWKQELPRRADTTRLLIEVCPYPPGTSKGNKIEPRLFCHITRNWRGVPLATYEVVVNLVSSTRTSAGLEVHCWLEEKGYAKGRKVSEQEFAAIRIRRNKFHGDWNYEILPRLR
jgi:Rhodopirellula transposase DDE domain